MRKGLWLVALLAACGGAAEGNPDGGAPPDGGSGTDGGFALAPAVMRGYQTHDREIGGPERGFYRYVTITDGSDLGWVRRAGYRLVYSYVRLDAYRAAPIEAALLSDLARGLDEARAEGLKVVLRFAYNEGPYPNSEPDAPLDRVLGHIAQVQPLLRAHADVLAVVQAGFIGAWGEWHTSTNGLLDDPADRRAILEALLDALPPERSTQIRYPLYKEEMYGPPRSAADAFDGSYAARVGHHNDCFVSSNTDVGTYPDNAVDMWRDYVAADTAWVPMGGETCAVYPARSDCAPAMAEMARLHVSFLNEDYHPDVVEGWRDQGCYDEIRRRLGYRFAVREASFPEAVRPGGAFSLVVRVGNDGWAAPFNPRPLRIVLVGGDGPRAATAEGVEVRRWLAGQVHEVSLRVQLPIDLPPGAHELALALPDPLLGDRPEYALPFANDGFDAARGLMVLGTLQVDDAAPGDADPAADTFAVR